MTRKTASNRTTVAARRLALIVLVVGLVVSAAACLAAESSRTAWTVLGAGIALTLVIVFYLLLLARDQARLTAMAAALQQSEATLRQITGAAKDAIVLIDEAGLVSFWNPAAEQLFGYTAKEALGQPVHELIAPERDREAFSKGLAGYRTTGQGAAIGRSLELVAKRQDGTEFPVELSLASFRQRAGWHAIGIIRDITDRHRVAAALAASEERHRALFDLSRDAIMTLDQTGFLDCNPAALRMFGCAGRTQFLAKSPVDFSPPVQPDGRDSMSAAQERMAAAFSTGEQFFEWTHRRPDGTTFPAEVLLSRFEYGGKVLLQATVRDISERRQAEAALRTSEALFRQVFEILPIGLWVADKDGRLVQGNPAGVAIWGAEPHVAPADYGVFKARRLPSGEAVRPEEWALVRTIREGATVRDELLEIDALDGRKRIILNYTSPVRDDQGEVAGAVVVNLDITERHQLEQQLRQEQKLAAVGNLARGMAHEINNPIFGIANYAQLIRDDLPPDSALAEYAAEIIRESERVATLLRRLLAFSGQEPQTPRAASLDALLDDVLALMAGHLEAAGVKVERQIPAELPPIRCRYRQMEELLMNLIANAQEALDERYPEADPDKLLRLSADLAERQGRPVVRLTVEDHGAGITEQATKHLFEPFFTTKSRSHFAGLGLTAARGTAREQGGDLWLDASRAGLTRFYLEIPLEPTAGAGVNAEVDHG